MLTPQKYQLPNKEKDTWISANEGQKSWAYSLDLVFQMIVNQKVCSITLFYFFCHTLRMLIIIIMIVIQYQECC